MSAKIIFITATDTGVGKTLLTALLLCHLRATGSRALALKPFCSGGRADAELLHELQDGELSLDEVNPYYFPEPVAPLISARKHKRCVRLEHVIRHVRSIAERLSSSSAKSAANSPPQDSKHETQNFLLIEGSGGLLVPLGEGYTVRDLILRLDCDVLVVSRNQLGTINHTLLTVQALWNSWRESSKSSPCPSNSARAQYSDAVFMRSKVVLMHTPTRDVSSRTNSGLLVELLAPVSVIELPFLGRNCASPLSLRKAAEKLARKLAQLA